MTDKIQIELTKDQHLNLMNLTRIGMWVATAYNENGDGSVPHFNEVQQLIYSHAKEAGFDNLIEKDEKTNEFWETREYDDSDEQFMQYIDEYDNENFWEKEILKHREIIPSLPQ